MRSRVERVQGTTFSNSPVASSKAVTLAGAATARPPSLRKRCARALYVGRARTLSPTQLRPITIVSHAIRRFSFSRPFPTIVHPHVQVGTLEDTSADDLVDAIGQRHRISPVLSQLVNTDRLIEFETMPEPVRNAKSEHNGRAGPDGQSRGRRRGPRRPPKEGAEDAFCRLHGLVGKDHHRAVLRQSFHQRATRLALVDYCGPGPLAKPLKFALEQLVVERPGHAQRFPDHRRRHQAAELPRTPVTAHEQNAFAAVE